MRDVCFTVDVEDFFLPRPPMDTVFARVAGEEWGIERMMHTFDAFDARATFFVDVYNRTTLDEPLLARACAAIAESAHELGLHTHPTFPEGVRGYGMQQVMARCTLSEQAAFIRDGQELIERWTGMRTRTHRAGGYGANRDTLKALREYGITVDSSLYPGYAGCPLAREVKAMNACVDIEGVREIPVTLTRNRFGLPLPHCRWLGISLPMKIDLDWLDLAGLQAQIETALATTDAPVIVFMHSYSLLDLARGFRPAPTQLSKLRSLLAWLRNRGDVRLSSLGDAAPRACVHPVPIRRTAVCDFNLAKQPWRWARFAAGMVTADRLRKLWRMQGHDA